MNNRSKYNNVQLFPFGTFRALLCRGTGNQTPGRDQEMRTVLRSCRRNAVGF